MSFTTDEALSEYYVVQKKIGFVYPKCLNIIISQCGAIPSLIV